MSNAPAHPYTVTLEELERNIDLYIDSVFRQLKFDDFLILPKGSGYIEYPRFQEAYMTLYRLTNGFLEFTPEKVMEAWEEDALSFVVVRTILGFTPPEFSDVTNQMNQSKGILLPPHFARDLDRKVRIARNAIKKLRKRRPWVQAMSEAACTLISLGAPNLPNDKLHRLDKFDTKQGLASVRDSARMGASYPMVLYERFLGRPFASHRDSVSDLVGDLLEIAVANLLEKHRIPFRRTARAEKIPGFAQAPDFIIPDEHNPQVVIEAKIAGDDGTARDKVARITKLAQIRDQQLQEKGQTFQLVVCIDGRGFSVRRNLMRDLLITTQGKVFTRKTLADLIRYTDLCKFEPISNCQE